MVGYAGFLFLIARSGLSVGELFGGSDRPWDAPVKAQLGNIPGVTALTQVGIAAVAVSSVLLAHKYSRGELIKLLAVLALSIPRVIIYSERLAFLELAVPAIVVGAAWLANRGGVRRTVARAIPVVGLVLVAVVFSVFEYFRSWMFYRMRGESSFVEFVLNRLAGYYATAINNGQVILDHLRWPGRLPFDTLDNFWSVQGIYQLRLYEVLGGHERPYGKGGDEQSPYFDALQQFANPEFNNPSGYVAPFVDYGQVGGLVFFLLLGVVAGLLYRAFCRGSLVGLLVYPVFFTGLVEWPRYLYWFQGRCTFAWAGLFVVIIAITLARRRAGAGKVDACTDA
jgi:oligosaccharide repeat unit polymerase